MNRAGTSVRSAKRAFLGRPRFGFIHTHTRARSRSYAPKKAVDGVSASRVTCAVTCVYTAWAGPIPSRTVPCLAFENDDTLTMIEASFLSLSLPLSLSLFSFLHTAQPRPHSFFLLLLSSLLYQHFIYTNNKHASFLQTLSFLVSAPILVKISIHEASYFIRMHVCGACIFFLFFGCHHFFLD